MVRKLTSLVLNLKLVYSDTNPPGLDHLQVDAD